MFEFASYLFFKQVKQSGFKLYTEHQQIENPYRQFNFIKGYFLIAVLDFLYGKPIRKLIDGFVGVCQDITDFEASYLRHHVKQYLIHR